MKKYLHGKRYLRSRYTVEIGRRNKMVRKMNKFIIVFSHVDWKKATENFVKALQEMS